MAKIRALVVEDSLTVRHRLVEILSESADIEVIAEAADGKAAIEICQELRPDVISMDMMLPLMTGLSATEYIMAHCPTPILIVSASVNRGELFRTYDALAAGAVDVLEKPTGKEPEDVWAARYIAALKLVSRIKVITHPRARLQSNREFASSAPASAKLLTPQIKGNCAVVAVGASTGGPGAIVEVLRGLPKDFRLPILLVLHINEPFGSAFADWLDAQTERRVACAVDGEALALVGNRVVMPPGDWHLAIRDGRLRLHKEPERHSCRPSVDVLFESMAAEYGPNSLGCLLTGMGKDGAAGLLDIRKAGGLTIAQDEATSVIYGMPREAVALGAAQHVLPLPEIGPAIGRLTAPAGRRP